MHPSKDENSSLQAFEIEALSAILGEEFVIHTKNSFSINIKNVCGKEVFLQVTLPESYPLNSAPQYELSAPWMNRGAKIKLYAEIEDIYQKHMGESIIYMFVEHIKDFIEAQTINKRNNDNSKSQANNELCTDIELPTIIHGESIIDRKSVFQAHLARISSESQIPLVLNKLKEISKIAEAKHNVYAYRILLENGRFHEDCDNDNEAKAGSVLLHLLQTSDVSNILIVVTRWYGGIQLGQCRFRHYNNAAKNLMSSLGFAKVKAKRTTTQKKKK